jgi:hypothetical protein
MSMSMLRNQTNEQTKRKRKKKRKKKKRKPRPLVRGHSGVKSKKKQRIAGQTTYKKKGVRKLQCMDEMDGRRWIY